MADRARILSLGCVFLAGCASHARSRQAEVPIPLVTVEQRFAIDDAGAERLHRTRTEYRDALGRLHRWEARDGSGVHTMTWVAVFHDDERAPRTAAYWSLDSELPSSELFVASADGRVVDVAYASPGRKPRREMRIYYDAVGRELYQEYFAPKSQRMYSEEVYAYDADGNEVSRSWRRLDGRARKDTEFRVDARDRHGRWTERLVTVDGAIRFRDRRTITDGWTTATRAPAAAGPVASSDEILPLPFARGVIAQASTGENMATFGPDGTELLFTRYEDDWTEQTAWIATFRDGVWQEAEPAELPTPIYNCALSADGRRVVFCRRTDDGIEVAIAERTADGSFGAPQPLELEGSYFRLLADGTLYFHRNGDLFRARLVGNRVEAEEPLGPSINTPTGVEFGAWVDANQRHLLFTRSVDGEPRRSGVFASRRGADGWSNPRRLPIPYGWGAAVTPDGEDLVYVVEDDLVRVPIVLLGIDDSDK